MACKFIKHAHSARAVYPRMRELLRVLVDGVGVCLASRCTYEDVHTSSAKSGLVHLLEASSSLFEAWWAVFLNMRTPDRAAVVGIRA